MNSFHPLVAEWFLNRVGKPTRLQEEAWPAIAAGENVLLAAPTGSGKTLAAFLWAVNQLLSGKWTHGCTSVLYVSPLRALNNDIQRNLLQPLEELRVLFKSRGADYPQINVMTRSGDTPPAHRRQMVRQPPEILITTPESLNLILSSPTGRSILREIRSVILDEVHAVIGNKRGVHLMTAVDRLVLLSGEFQRIGLSATIKPLETVAEFIGGYRLEEGPHYSARRVRFVQSSQKKSYEIRLRFPDGDRQEGGKDTFWGEYTQEIRKIIQKNRSTLVFTNSRRLCEKLTHLINIDEQKPVAYAHHGSLSREIRTEVEEKLKAGELKAIVATNSLELGIDIGKLDEVVLIQSPPSISSAIQRIGRAGHQVGQVSRGTLYPTDPLDIIEAAVLARSVMGNDIESTKPIHCPLDVLAQVIISMAGVETWDLEKLFNQLRTSSPYRSLTREHFDLVIQMLAGQYHGTRLRELQPRISLDRIDRTVAARKGSLQAVYLSGGTIPDRGYFHLRHKESNAKIGDLDEEFVWEASVGQVFTLGTQNWKIERITHSDVFVTPANSGVTAPPFWKAEESLRGFHFSERIGEFLEWLNDRLDDPHLESSLRDEYFMDKAPASKLIAFLREQRRVTRCALPHRHHLLLEQVGSGPGGYPGTQVVLHTTWGGSVNRPYAMALEAAWDERYGYQLEVYVSNDCIVLQLPDETGKEEILSLVGSGNLGNLLKRKLEGSGYFGARFRENAGRALLLPRRKGQERMPLWLSRLRSQKLLGSVMRFHDFPILLETWRTCLRDEFDMDSLHRMVGELESGIITSTETHTSSPSPMARSATWGQINRYVYMDDAIGSGKTSNLRQDLIRDVIFTPALRPAVPERLIEQFELKRKRLSPGYSPETSRELLDWVKERLLVPATEWEGLLGRAEADYGMQRKALLEPIAEKLVRLSPPAASEPLMAALEVLPRVLRGLYPDTKNFPVELLSEAGRLPDLGPREKHEGDDDEDGLFMALLGEWLQFYGPVQESFIIATLGCHPEGLRGALADLVDSERALIGRLVKDSDQEFICDSGNFELLLRVARAEARPAFEALDIRWFPLFLAQHQGITTPATGVEGLFQRIEQLLCYPEAAELWESEIFPARVKPYETQFLDTLMQSGDLSWIGSKRRRVSFYFKSDVLLPSSTSGDGAVTSLFPDSRARYDFATLVHLSKSRPSEVAETLWNAVWRGLVTIDSFIPLRQGIGTGFRTPTPIEGVSGRRRRRMGFSQWRSSYPFAGTWQLISNSSSDDDLIEREERNKDRVRLLLERYGILFREMLRNESAPFRWSSLFKSLRLMELSGEVLAGYFFHGVPGPQFISHEAFRTLQSKLPDHAVYWISALDPAALCGTSLDVLKGGLPRRIAGTHLVYHGHKLVLVSQGNGRKLTIHVPQDHEHLKEYWCVFDHLLERRFRPFRRIVVERINDAPANHSPFLEALGKEFELSVDYKKVTLYRKRTLRK